MRITGGNARGFGLRVPKITDIRPAQEMVRLAVYSILGDKVRDAEVLDLYAGSGSFGIEALSRGAKFATFIDSNPVAVQAIETNLKNARFWGKSKVVKQDAVMFMTEDHNYYDIIFVCPPYSYGFPKALFYHITEHLKPDGIVIFDHAKTTTFNKHTEGLEVIDQRSYGASGVTFFKLAEDVEESE